MRMLSLVLVLCAGCVKKPAAKQPGSPPPTVEERKDTSQPADGKPAPTGTKPKGDPCSGGE